MLTLVLLACGAPSPGTVRPVPTEPVDTDPPTDTAVPTPSDTGVPTPVDTDSPCVIGSACAPIVIGALPYVATGDTSLSDERTIDVYGCSPADEAGAEVWYQLEVVEPGLVVASVDDLAGDDVDVDVHLLTGITADTCLARDNVRAQGMVEPGVLYIVVDTWRTGAGMELPGPYTLTVDLRVTSGDCPSDMVQIDTTCIDRYEAHLVGQSPYDVPSGGVAANELDAVPQGYISGEVAQDACNAAGKRLCTTDEWLRACRGPNDRTYPYGYAYQPGVCNEGRSVHPVIELFGTGATFNATELNDPLLNQLPDSLAPSGAYTGCVTDEGVYDLHGNLHEWIDDPAGTFRGGFYVDATINGPGCTYRTTAHTFDYHDYSTGFRCCMDAP